MTNAPRMISALVLIAATTPLGGAAAKPTLHFSAHERRACRSEAIRFCAHTYPNKRDAINCLQAHMSQLGDRCRSALKSGVSARPSVSH